MLVEEIPGMQKEATETHKSLVKLIKKLGRRNAESVEVFWQIAETCVRKIESFEIESLADKAEKHLNEKIKVLVDDRLRPIESKLANR